MTKKYYYIIALIIVVIAGIVIYNQIISSDKKTCENAGGIWWKLGPQGEYVCNMPTSDAGKKCLDSDECEGSCIPELSEDEINKLLENVEVIQAKGKCTAWKIDSSGCHYFVENGEVGPRLCID
jgi:hypothetical protein